AALAAAVTLVARARRGDNPGWEWPRPAAAARRQLGRAFASPGQAQFWLAWGRRGVPFPLLIGCFLLFPLAMRVLAAASPDRRRPLGWGFLLSPTLVAAFAGPQMGTVGRAGRDPCGLASFLATRPRTCAALVADKLRVAAWSTLAGWGLGLLAL